MVPAQSPNPVNYDLFISYSHADRDWVNGYLVPRLERAGLKVAIDYRDFVAGVPSIVNMERAIERSRHVLLVMTPRWVASEWSDFEGILAGTGDPVGKRRKLVPLMVENCDPPPRIKALTYVDFRAPGNEEFAMAALIGSVSEGGAAQPLPVPAPKVDWRAELPDLLVRSGRVQSNARSALCIQTGIDVNDLTFLEAAPRDFALQLVNYLDQSGNREALKKICRVLEPVLKGAHSERLRAVSDALRET